MLGQANVETTSEDGPGIVPTPFFSVLMARGNTPVFSPPLSSRAPSPRIFFFLFFSFLPSPSLQNNKFFSSTFFISFPLLFFFTRIALRRDNGLRTNRAREILVTARVIASKIDYDKVGRIFGRLLATTRPRKLTFKTQARVRGWKKGCEKGEKGEGGNERMNERTKVG